MILPSHNHGGSCENACCLRIENLSVRAGNDRILDRVALHIHCGQIVALIGPNGGGKTTLIRAILGQEPYEGSIRFSTGGRPETLRIGYVPQSPGFDAGDPISVLDLFTSTGKRPAFLPVSTAARQAALDALAPVNGQSLIDKRVGTLSGGELQRVLLALALRPMPHLLILDEPFSGVDAEGIPLLLDLLDGIRNEFDLSILMSTHDFSTLERCADRVVLLDKTILRKGTPAEVLQSEEFLRTFRLEGGGAK